jgi:hypothetical protein
LADFIGCTSRLETERPKHEPEQPENDLERVDDRDDDIRGEPPYEDGSGADDHYGQDPDQHVLLDVVRGRPVLSHVSPHGVLLATLLPPFPQRCVGAVSDLLQKK